MGKEKIEDVPNILESQLKDIVKNIAIQHNSLPYIENQDFLDERLYEWHQFGLITHTKKVRQAFLYELDEILKQEKPYENIQIRLNEKVGGILKRRLLEISIPLHDLGKIVAYGDSRIDRNHEILSKNLVSQPFLRQKLENFGLNVEHMNYVKRCIETHAILGKKFRDILKHNGNLRLDFISKKNIKSMSEDLANEYSDIYYELGIFFMCDLLGKTDIRINCKTDKEIEQNESEIERVLKQKNLPQQLKKAVMQFPASMELAKTYLRLV